MDCIIIAVAHREYKSIKIDELKQHYSNADDNRKVLIDVKGIFSIDELERSGLNYWRL